MPFPIGHTMIGLTIYDLSGRRSGFPDWKAILFVSVLSNLPDLDIAAGLLIHGNGCAFHRGPTHSLAFALLAGVLAANAWRLWSSIPRMNWISGFLMIFSHVMGDFLLTKSPVSLFWPLDVHWTAGFSGWAETLMPILLEAYRDAGIALLSLCVMMLVRLRPLQDLLNRRVFLGRELE
jgi:membrane-bound metal-dependent hydrolase YbcI (DUF457 family)